MRDVHKLHGTVKDSDRPPATIRDSERRLVTQLDLSDSERQPATIGDSERHAATQLHWERK